MQRRLIEWPCSNPNHIWHCQLEFNWNLYFLSMYNALLWDSQKCCGIYWCLTKYKKLTFHVNQVYPSTYIAWLCISLLFIMHNILWPWRSFSKLFCIPSIPQLIGERHQSIQSHNVSACELPMNSSNFGLAIFSDCLFLVLFCQIRTCR